jgi:hypothetical protein
MFIVEKLIRPADLTNGYEPVGYVHAPEEMGVRMAEHVDLRLVHNGSFPRKGDKARFLGKNGYDAELKRAKETFTVGQDYEVASIEIGSWSSHITFVGIKHSWNSVMFSKVDPNRPEILPLYRLVPVKHIAEVE